MEKYINVTGMNHYFGSEIIEKEMILTLEKDHDNEYDKEAIAVKLKPLGKIGYVANSVCTVIGDCMSAGRLYDKIGETAKAAVTFVLDGSVVCRIIDEEDNGKESNDKESEQ